MHEDNVTVLSFKPIDSTAFAKGQVIYCGEGGGGALHNGGKTWVRNLLRPLPAQDGNFLHRLTFKLLC